MDSWLGEPQARGRTVFAPATETRLPQQGSSTGCWASCSENGSPVTRHFRRNDSLLPAAPAWPRVGGLLDISEALAGAGAAAGAADAASGPELCALAGFCGGVAAVPEAACFSGERGASATVISGDGEGTAEDAGAAVCAVWEAREACVAFLSESGLSGTVCCLIGSTLGGACSTCSVSACPLVSACSCLPAWLQ